MANFKNLTPHQLNIHKEDGSVMNIEPSGVIARVASKETLDTVIDGVEVFQNSFGEVQDLPAPEEGVYLIVSGLVLGALGGTRPDVLAPGQLVRNDKGQPIGAKGLRR